MKILSNPYFSPNDWKNNIKAGCYPYAMDWRHLNSYLLIGDLIGKPMDSDHSDKELVQTFKEELENEGYLVIESDADKEISGYKKIFLMRSRFNGRYHLFRQDVDGWSHKYPGELPVNVDFQGRVLEDPGLIDEGEFYGWYFLVGKKTG